MRSFVLRIVWFIKIYFCECFLWMVLWVDCFIIFVVFVFLWFDCVFLLFCFLNMNLMWVVVLKYGRWRRDFGFVKKLLYFGVYFMKFL